MYISEQLASFVKKTSLGDVPPKALHTAKNSILDCLGVAVAGATEPASEIITGFIADLGGSGDATLIAKKRKAAPTDAALVNATMAHALDFDDSTDTLGGHPTVVILPAILAIGQKLKSSGKQILEAYLIGFELEAQLAKLVNFEHYDKGWHPTATLGTFASAGACAKLLKLDEKKTVMAFSIAVSMASGVKENFGSMTKPLHAGLSSRNGLMAAMLAGQGFTAKKSAFEGKKGFFEVYNGPGKYRLENLEKSFGNPWDIEHSGVAIKQYPCCGSTHPAVDAILHLANKLDLKPEEIDKIQIAVHPRRLAHTNCPQPLTSLEAKFSVQYAAAVATVNRGVKLDDFSDQALRREEIQKMLGRIEAGPLSEDKWGPEHFAAEVDITCKDGRRLHHRVEKAKGRGPRYALTEEELEQKFFDCMTRRFSLEDAQGSLSMIKAIENLEDIGLLMNRFAG